MSRPKNFWNIQEIGKSEDDEKKKQFLQIQAITLCLKEYYNILNGGIIPADNNRGAVLSVTFTALNTNTAVKHGLGFVPQFYQVWGTSGDMRVYDGTTTNTTNFINLRVAGTTGSARIFVF